jgi:hypothetical protein
VVLKVAKIVENKRGKKNDSWRVYATYVTPRGRNVISRREWFRLVGLTTTKEGQKCFCILFSLTGKRAHLNGLSENNGGLVALILDKNAQARVRQEFCK